MIGLESFVLIMCIVVVIGGSNWRETRFGVANLCAKCNITNLKLINFGEKN